MCVNIINGETNNHTIQEKEQPKNKRIFAMDNSAVILSQYHLSLLSPRHSRTHTADYLNHFFEHLFSAHIKEQTRTSTKLREDIVGL